MPLEIKCCGCGELFKTYPSSVANGKRWCSRRCMKLHGAHRNNARTHGESGTRLYGIWCHMKTRCLCPTAKAYSYYGGRGITVCPEWVGSFETFRDWANANGYTESLEIDRIDPNGNYEPGNCRWATRRQQLTNTRKRVDAATSKFKGVSWCANVGKWRTQLHRDGRPVHVGLFTDEVAAAKAYDKAASEQYGEFAYLNFRPQGGVPR